MAWVAALRGQMGVAVSEIRQAIEMGRTVGDPTLEIWACEILCLVLVAARRPQAMTEEMETLLRVRHEWGGLGEALSPPSRRGPVCWRTRPGWRHSSS